MSAKRIEKKVDKNREEVVHDIAKGTAKYIMKRAVEEAPDIMDAVDVGHDVVRHLMKKLGAERRSGERRQ